MSRSALTRPTANGQRKGVIPSSILPSQQHSYELYATVTAGGYPAAAGAAPVPDGVVVGYPYYSYPGMTPSANETNTGVVGQASGSVAMTPEAMYYYAQYYQQAAAIAAAAGALADPSGQQLVLNANAAAATRNEEEVDYIPPPPLLLLIFSSGTHQRSIAGSWKLVLLQH